MMNIMVKCVISFFVLLSSLPALEVERYIPDSLNNVQVYSLKNIDNLRQLTLKGRNLKVEIIGNEKGKFEIYSNHDLGLTGRGGNDEDYKFDFDEFFEEFYKYSKENASSKGSVEKIELKDGISLHSSGNENFAIFDITCKAREISIDFPKLNANNNTPLKIIIPKSLALNIKLKKGDVRLKNIDSDVFIRGKQLDTVIENLKGVFNYDNLSGDVRIKNFDGVSTVKMLSGEIDFRNMIGDLKIKNSAGDFKMEKFDGRLTLDTKVGDIDLADVKDSDVMIDTKSGDISMKNFVSCNMIDIKSSFGEINVEDSQVKVLKIRSEGGAINLKGHKGQYDIELKAGDVHINTDQLDLSVDNFVSVDYGDIILNLEKREQFDFYRSTSDEKLMPEELNLYNDRSLRIFRRDKRDYYMNLSVNSGRIEIR